MQGRVLRGTDALPFLKEFRTAGMVVILSLGKKSAKYSIDGECWIKTTKEKLEKYFA